MSKVLCTICARGGSTGVPNKNLHEIGGRPLVGVAIADAKEWGRCDDIVVSTDDEEIATVAHQYGASVPFERPPELATDEAAKLPVIQHALREMEDHRGVTYDHVVDLDVTAPLRNRTDIDACMEAVLGDPAATNAYTVCVADRNPYFNMVELDDEGYASLSKRLDEEVIRRQDAPEVYQMNAAVYVYERDYLATASSTHGEYTRVSVMPPERSVDIDTERDLMFVEFLVERGIVKL